MKMFFRGIIIFAFLLSLWQATTTLLHLPNYILPSPLVVLHTLFTNANLIFEQSIPTLIELLFGLILGITFGVLSALIIVSIKPARAWFLPILLISQAIPTFAIAPLLVVWFGYGMTSKIITIIIMLFFPVTNAFYDGLRKTPQSYLDLAITMHASAWQTLIRIKIPAALPDLASGIRLSTVIAPIGAVVSEWVGASRGLGYLMLNANARMEIDLMFAALLTIMFFTIFLYFVIDKLLQRLIFWQKIK